MAQVPVRSNLNTRAGSGFASGAQSGREARMSLPHRFMSKTTVLFHSADYDGLFCREIARKFLPADTQFIGWDFGDKTIEIPDGKIYVLDLPVDKPLGLTLHSPAVTVDAPANIPKLETLSRIVWIDHHKSAIESHPSDIPGYRIDGVAACRLAWQWFTNDGSPHLGGYKSDPELPTKEEFVNRKVYEPLAVRLAGEHDIWDHRDPRASLLQFGLDSVKEIDWDRALSTLGVTSDGYVDQLCERGEAAKAVIDKRNADVMRERSFIARFEGLNFLACNFVRCNSQSFASLDKPGTGHDALCAFWWNGKEWSVSLYHAEHRKDIDLSQIAVKHGGGGHRGACGFRCETLPFTAV